MNKTKLVLSIIAIVGMVVVLALCWKSGPWNMGAALLILAVIGVIWYLWSSLDEEKEPLDSEDDKKVLQPKNGS